MWRRTYLILVLVRLYFAMWGTSYIHPDENFQGPEVIAGQIFSYPVHLTWEFTSPTPIRSVFPLWPIYGLPMLLLKWVWLGSGSDNEVTPAVVFWALRALMFLLSFVLEDWAIHELIQSPRQRRVAVLLVASSYVTCTYQTHTLSNSVETLLVAWCLVIIQRIGEDKRSSSPLASAILAFLTVFGVFNRITFPAFLLLPGLTLLPHFYKKPLSLLIFLTTSALTTALAITIDTSFYAPTPLTLHHLLHAPTITPLNNLLYNSSTSNLATHGLHPAYTHLLINLPLLLGPAFPLLFTSASRPFTARFFAALSSILILSLFPHQEARFLLPAIPLLLSSLHLPLSRTPKRAFLASWVVFNVALALLMGVMHQGGVVPAQLFLAGREDATVALWWKTYSPPIWLLDGKNEVLNTRDLMGMRTGEVEVELLAAAVAGTGKNGSVVGSWFGGGGKEGGTYLVAPLSATFLDRFVSSSASPSSPSSSPPLSPSSDKEDPTTAQKLHLDLVFSHANHLNLDDMDFAEDGVWATLKRVVGRRGIGVWRVSVRSSAR